MASSRDKTPSEFGGVPGLVAPLPHEATNVDLLRWERATEASDPTDTAEKARLRELDREGRL